MVAEHPRHEYTLVVDRATAEQARLPAGARLEVVDTREQPTRAASSAERALARSTSCAWPARRPAYPLDLFLFPAVYSYYPMLRRVPTVVTFHDAIAENHPALIFPGARARLFWRAKSWLANRQADRILTVSSERGRGSRPPSAVPESSMPGRAGGTGRRLPACATAPRPATCWRTTACPPTSRSSFYVGGLSPHKNLDGLLHAFARPMLGPARWHLALVGDHSGDSFLGCYARRSCGAGPPGAGVGRDLHRLRARTQTSPSSTMPRRARAAVARRGFRPPGGGGDGLRPARGRQPERARCPRSWARRASSSTRGTRRTWRRPCARLLDDPAAAREALGAGGRPCSGRGPVHLERRGAGRGAPLRGDGRQCLTPLRFCMVTTFYPPHHFGGDAMFVYRLAEALAERGHAVDVVHSRGRLSASSTPRTPRWPSPTTAT